VVEAIKELAFEQARYLFCETKNSVSDNFKFSNSLLTPQNANNAENSSSQGDGFVLFAFGGFFALFITKNSHTFVAVFLFLWILGLLWKKQKFKQKNFVG